MEKVPGHGVGRAEELAGRPASRPAKNFWGGDATKNDNFQRGKVRVQGYKNFQHVIMSSCHIFEFWGGDATKNDNFQRRKVIVQGRKNFQERIFVK